MRNKKIKVIYVDLQSFRNMTMQYDKKDNFKSLNLFFKIHKEPSAMKNCQNTLKIFSSNFFS